MQLSESENSEPSRSQGKEAGDRERKLSRRPELAAKGFLLETKEEYAKRRAQTVAKFGGKPEKPESPEKYEARRRRLESEWKDRVARRATYEASRTGPLPGVALADVKVGDVFDNAVLVGELDAAKVNERGTGPKAFFDIGVWRRRSSDNLPVRVHCMVRLAREGKDYLKYFTNDKTRKQRIYITETQHASARVIGSFSPIGAYKVGRKDGGLPLEMLPSEVKPDGSEVVLDAEARREGGPLAWGSMLGSATVLEMTHNACWLDLHGPKVFERSKKDGKLRPVRARLCSWDLDPETQCLASTFLRKESITQVIRVGDTLSNVVVKSARPAAGQLDVVLGASALMDVPSEAALQDAVARERRRAARRRARRRKATQRLVAAMQALKSDPAKPGRWDVALSATVVEVKAYGLVVDVGALFTGLVHVSEVAKTEWVGKPPPQASAPLDEAPAAYIEDLKGLVKVGQQLRVRLLAPPPPPPQGAGSVRLSKKQAKARQAEEKGPERDKFTFEVAKWIGGAPVDPSYQDDGMWPEGISLEAQEEEEEEVEDEDDLSGYFIPDEEGGDNEEDEEGDIQDEWEDRFGMGDNEYY